MIPPLDIAQRIQAIPEGTTTGFANGRKFVTSHSIHNNGKSRKVVAEELGGTGYISANFYHLTDGARLYPCEMEADKVIAFLRTYEPESPAI